jgi:DNA-binding IclR family transcriptional regulator
MSAWKFLTNHVQVLSCIATEPGIRLRDIAVRVDITERAAHRIVSELEDHGYLTRHKVGARNFYEIHPEQPLRHRAQPELTIGDLLALLLDTSSRRATARARSDTS